jgi:arylsulfatase A-like enzyme
MVGKWHLGHANRRLLPHARGFDHFYGHVNGNIDYYTHEREGAIDWQRNGVSVHEEGYSTDLLAREAVRMITGRDRSRPLFLYLAFNAPHTPLQAPKEAIAPCSHIPDAKRRVFAAMVETMDRAIGTVLRTLEQEGMARDTLIVFLSDNGGPINAGARNDPLRAGKATVFEGGIRVPALMWWPGRLPAGRVSDQVMTVQDVLHTLASAAGGKPLAAKPLDGEDLWPAILAGRSVTRGDLFFAVEPGDETRQLAVRRGAWKLIRRIEKPTGRHTDLLFNIEGDPRETTDLAAKNPQLVRELGVELDRWQAFHPRCEIFTTMGPHPGWVPPKDWAKAAAE